MGSNFHGGTNNPHIRDKSVQPVSTENTPASLDATLIKVGENLGVQGVLTRGRAINILEATDRDAHESMQRHGLEVTGTLELFRQELARLAAGKISPHQNPQALAHAVKDAIPAFTGETVASMPAPIPVIPDYSWRKRHLPPPPSSQERLAADLKDFGKQYGQPSFTIEKAERILAAIASDRERAVTQYGLELVRGIEKRAESIRSGEDRTTQSAPPVIRIRRTDEERRAEAFVKQYSAPLPKDAHLLRFTDWARQQGIQGITHSERVQNLVAKYLPLAETLINRVYAETNGNIRSLHDRATFYLIAALWFYDPETHDNIGSYLEEYILRYLALPSAQWRTDQFVLKRQISEGEKWGKNL